MLRQHKAYVIFFTRAIALGLSVLMVIQDIAFALPEKIYQDNSTLAVRSQISDAEFRERFAMREFLLSHDAVNKYIDDQVKKEIGIFGEERWKHNRTHELDLNHPNNRGNYCFFVPGLDCIKLVSVTGLI